jgi:hypothetical protein
MPKTMKRLIFAGSVCGALAALALAGPCYAQTTASSSPDLSGTYQCKPNPDPCTWSGATATVSQNGNKVTIKGADGAVADASLTSPSTISAAATLNSLGIVRSDHSIDWSDGTKWSKQ